MNVKKCVKAFRGGLNPDPPPEYGRRVEDVVVGSSSFKTTYIPEVVRFNGAVIFSRL